MDKAKFQDRKEWRTFGLGVTVILLGIAIIQMILGGKLAYYFLAGSIIFLLIALVLPVLLKPVYILFSYIGLILGWVMTRVILIILFYLVVTPISLISRLTGKKFLDLDFSKRRNSYWISLERKGQDKTQYEKQF